jgi:putative transposase
VTISKSWRNNWDQIIPFFAYPGDIRKAIYTTNAIESLNMTLRKVIKTRAAFPTDDAIFKLLYLSLRNITKRWTMPIRNWKAALSQFAIIFEGRVPMF